MKAKSQDRTCPDVMSNECIVWQGGDVPFLGISNGDGLDESEKLLADKIVDLYGKIDMSKVDMHCLQDNCAQNCKDTSLQGVIQSLFDNQCCLADLINGEASLVPLPTINVNMRCLTKFDDFGNVVPQDLNQSIQSIINQVCTDSVSITSVQTELNDLQQQVDAINTTPVTPPEINITTCLTSLRPISQTVPIVASSLCEFQTLIGSQGDVTQAMSNQCANLNSTFASTQGWNTSVGNMAESFGNLWLLACNLSSRLTVIENNCCKVTCDDVKVGFDVTVDASGTGVFLKFTAGAGTSIPPAFTDGGSSVIITDDNGNSVNYPLVISNNANQGDFDVSGLDIANPITISVTAILSTDGLTCEKCITKMFALANLNCPVCKISAAGSEGNVTIAYTLPGNTNVQTITLENGQVGYIQTNAVIASVVSTGDITADSNCIDLTPPPTTCYTFYWAHSTESTDDTLHGFVFNTVIIGNVTYTISSPYVQLILNNAGQRLFDAISAVAPPAIIQPVCVLRDDSFLSKISVRVPSKLAAPVIKASGNTGVSAGDTVSLYMYGVPSTDPSTECGCSVSSGGIPGTGHSIL